MVQKLTKVGDTWAILLDQPTLDRLRIVGDTAEVVEAEGKLVVSPHRDPDREAKFVEALETMSKRYEKTLRRLAE